MKKILCPTDFSDAALGGIAYAAKLAKMIGADITLFNVVALTDLFPEEVLMGEQVYTEAAKARLDTQCREVTKIFKVSCYGETEASTTSVSKMIAAKALGYDLVVMGTNGIDDLTQFILGSHTYRAIKKTSVPIIMVPQHAVYAEIKRLVYAYDQWRSDHLPLTQLISFSKMVGSDITVLQVLEESISQDADRELAHSRQAIQNLYRDDVNLKFETIHADKISDGISNFMKQSQADLLALCSEHRNFLSSLFHESTIRRITGVANFPVLVFHS